MRLFVPSIMFTETFLKKEHTAIKNDKIMKRDLSITRGAIRIYFYTVICNGSNLGSANRGGF